LHIANPIWAVVSATVVILPGHRASVASAALRVIANLVGAGVGIAISALGLPAIAALGLGLLVVATVCRALAIDSAARSASVGFIIVALGKPGSAIGSSEMRIFLVMIGCVVAFLVTLIAARIENRRARV
jgi:uncharacterized membrane protein YgaE (UPF0421/DUF939 family)